MLLPGVSVSILGSGQGAAGLGRVEAGPFRSRPRSCPVGAPVTKAGVQRAGSGPGSFTVGTGAKLGSLGPGKHLQRDLPGVVGSIRQETGPTPGKLALLTYGKQ